MPIGTTLFSAVLHLAVLGAFVIAATFWKSHQPKTYVVNLVPAVPAIGVPKGSPTAPALPPRREEPPPRVRSAPNELPQREPRASAPPEMPTRTREAVLPERTLPSRAPALPQPSDKELPTIASAPKPAPPPTAPAATVPKPSPPSPPPQPVGTPTGSPQGAGALTLNVGDFPFGWYLRQISQKTQENWKPPVGSAIGQQAVVVFEISRDGSVRRPAIEKASGNPLYDQAALRAIVEANPFPPLPPEFKEPMLRVHLGFTFTADRG